MACGELTYCSLSTRVSIRSDPYKAVDTKSKEIEGEAFGMRIDKQEEPGRKHRVSEKRRQRSKPQRADVSRLHRASIAPAGSLARLQRAVDRGRGSATCVTRYSW